MIETEKRPTLTLETLMPIGLVISLCIIASVMTWNVSMTISGASVATRDNAKDLVGHAERISKIEYMTEDHEKRIVMIEKDLSFISTQLKVITDSISVISDSLKRLEIEANTLPLKLKVGEP